MISRVKVNGVHSLPKVLLLELQMIQFLQQVQTQNCRIYQTNAYQTKRGVENKSEKTKQWQSRRITVYHYLSLKTLFALLLSLTSSRKKKRDSMRRRRYVHFLSFSVARFRKSITNWDYQVDTILSIFMNLILL